MIQRKPFTAMVGVIATIILAFPCPACAETYDLQNVKDIGTFQGSAEAKEMLAKNGFVVADPSFKQIFQAYIESPETAAGTATEPMGQHLPSFITTDSAWDTYHFLLEEGVKRMEVVQARRLAKFSELLLKVLREQKADPQLELFASVGRALQDADYGKTIGQAQTRIVDGLRNGIKPVDAPIGFELSPGQFRAQSFYTESPELSDYFAARQWYATVVFRLSDAGESRLALELSYLVNNDPELSKLWKQLSDPYDDFVAAPEDGTVFKYVQAAESIAGTNYSGNALSDAQVAEIQLKLESQLQVPLINDQSLSPAEYLRFDYVTRGFRLMPPRRLPDAVCFQNTVDPKIPNRLHPSGLDFMAASPVMRSPAAMRAVRGEFAKDVSDRILDAYCGPMPDSLYGKAMELLAKLQEPLPAQAPVAMRTDAWGDLQLWSQLGAWAEQRHTWALHAKLTVEVGGIIEPPTGMVAPYPEFFSGLATLTRQTAAAFEKAGMDESFNVSKAANQVLDDIKLDLWTRTNGQAFDLNSAPAGLGQYYEFQNRYCEKHPAEFRMSEVRNWDAQFEKDMEQLAARCTNGQASAADTETLQIFFDGRDDIIRPLDNFADVCDQLSNLARKSLNGQTLTKDDATWIENYGVTLAGLHFYGGNSYEVPEDNFPIVTRIYVNATADSTLYAGLARPQALYIIIPTGNSLQLYRGAVMTYREFVQPNSRLLDDDSWREMVSSGKTPPAPPFTKSFYAETSVHELLTKLQIQSQGELNYGDMRDLLWQIGARATEKDLPALFHLLTNVGGEEGNEIIDGISQIIAQLPWKPYEKQIDELLSSPDHGLANAAAQILIAQPNEVDLSLLISGFAQQPLHTRRLCCVILSTLPNQTQATHESLLQALRDPEDVVRWQAALAIEKAGWIDAQSESALLEATKDTNQFVGAAAVHSLGHLEATNEAPALLAELGSVPHLQPDDVEVQSQAIYQDTRDEHFQPNRLLDVDGLETQVELAGMHNYDLTTVLIGTLTELNYAPATDELFKLLGTAHDCEAAAALLKLAPGHFTDELVARAKDNHLDAGLRENALEALCSASATNRVRELIPLLDDSTLVDNSSLPGRGWRICDRAAEAIAVLLGWQPRMTPLILFPQRGDEMLSRARDWSKKVN